MKKGEQIEDDYHDGQLPPVKNITPRLQSNNDQKTSLIPSAEKNLSSQRTQGPPYLKNRLPPKSLKVSTVTVTRRNKYQPEESEVDMPTPVHTMMLPLTPRKWKRALLGQGRNKGENITLPSLKECIESRPPLHGDLGGPTVYSYNPPNDKPEMSSFPSYTLRPKTQQDRAGGDRTSWSKEWFSHNHVWLQKTDFDTRVKWPSPAHYDVPDVVGSSKTVFNHSPSHTFGKRKEFSLIRKGSENDPAPNAYRPGTSKDRIMNRKVCFTIPQGRKQGTSLWPKRECVPGPGSYDTITESKCIKPRSASFSFATSPRNFDFKTK